MVEKNSFFTYQDGNTHQIFFAGAGSILYIEELHQLLKKIQSSPKPVILDLSKAESLDTAVLQLLYSFNKGRKKNAKIKFTNVPELIRENLYFIGFKESNIG